MWCSASHPAGQQACPKHGKSGPHLLRAGGFDTICRAVAAPALVQHNKHPDVRNNNAEYTTDIDTNPNTIDDAKIMTNMKQIHTAISNTYLNNRQHNKVTNTISLTVHHSETTLSRTTRRTLAKRRTIVIYMCLLYVRLG